jgi:hypothetical protein
MKTKKSGLVVLVVVILGIAGLSGGAVGGKIPLPNDTKAPLPNDINIVTPPTDLPPEIRAFSGKWAGKWDHFRDAILIVERINLNDALIVYAWGKVPIWRRAGEGHRRFEAKVYFGPKQPFIEFEIKRVDQPVVTFEMQKDLNTIKGFWVWIVGDARPIMRIIMKRID